MVSLTASKRTTRLVAAILVSFSASAAFAQQESAAGSSVVTGRPPAPAWGSANTSVLTLYAWDFASLDDSAVTFTTGTRLRLCFQSGGFVLGGCFLSAGVHLPSGAVIESMELAGCDNDAGLNMFANLNVAEDPSGVELVIASIQTLGSPGCLRFSVGPIGETVENFEKSYWVTVFLPENPPVPTVTLRSVRLFYRLQVSPAPDFASFNDVPVGGQYHQFVEALYASGITAGCGGGNYCPNNTLTRGQMAVFLAKALGLHWPN